jgi:hypothetical protein
MTIGSDALRSHKAVQTLNELLGIIGGSLPAYLADARPWTPSDDPQLRSAFERLAADQRRYARRLSDAITEHGGRPDSGRFAMNFTAKNDLSLKFLRQEVIDRQEQDILAIRRCADRLEDVSSLHSLAEEMLGNARGHLDILKDMMKDENDTARSG